MAGTSSSAPSYPWRLRRRDRGHGYRDGRRRIPSLAEVRQLRAAGRPITAAYPEVLIGEMFQRADELYREFENASQQRRHHIRAIETDIATTEEAIQDCRDRVRIAAAPLTPEELMPRNPDEQRRAAREPDFLRYRREIWRQWRTDKARKALEAKQAELAGHLRGRDDAYRDLDGVLDRYRTEVRRLSEVYNLRIATYWDGVMRTHVDGRHLTALLAKPDVPLPAWVHQPIGPGPDTPSHE